METYQEVTVKRTKLKFYVYKVDYITAYLCDEDGNKRGDVMLHDAHATGETKEIEVKR